MGEMNVFGLVDGSNLRVDEIGVGLREYTKMPELLGVEQREGVAFIYEADGGQNARVSSFVIETGEELGDYAGFFPLGLGPTEELINTLNKGYEVINR